MSDKRAEAPKPEVEALRNDIRQTRAELGDTVQALAAKADVKARVSQSAAETRDRVSQSAAEVGQRVRESVVEAGQRVRESAAHTTARVKDSAEHAVERTRRLVGAHPNGTRDGHPLGVDGNHGGPAVLVAGGVHHGHRGQVHRGPSPSTPAAVRQRMVAIGESARRRPAPWLAFAGGAGAAAVIVFLIARGRRR